MPQTPSLHDRSGRQQLIASGKPGEWSNGSDHDDTQDHRLPSCLDSDHELVSFQGRIPFAGAAASTAAAANPETAQASVQDSLRQEHGEHAQVFETAAAAALDGRASVQQQVRPAADCNLDQALSPHEKCADMLDAQPACQVAAAASSRSCEAACGLMPHPNDRKRTRASKSDGEGHVTLDPGNMLLQGKSSTASHQPDHSESCLNVAAEQLIDDNPQPKKRFCCAPAISNNASQADVPDVPRGLPGKGLSLSHPDSGRAIRMAESRRPSNPQPAWQMVATTALQQAICFGLRAELRKQQQLRQELQVTMEGAMAELWERGYEQVQELRAELKAARAASQAAAAGTPVVQKLTPGPSLQRIPAQLISKIKSWAGFAATGPKLIVEARASRNRALIEKQVAQHSLESLRSELEACKAGLTGRQVGNRELLSIMTRQVSISPHGVLTVYPSRSSSHVHPHRMNTELELVV